MINKSAYLRLFKILKIIKSYQLLALFPKNKYRSKLSILLFFMFWVKKQAKNQPLSTRLGLAIQALGPIWIKFGQMLSTRQDLLPSDITQQLAKLQDQVIPFSSEQVIKIIEQAYNKKIEDIFINFDNKPLASASIAQVHTAALKKTNAQVVIKVLRPNMKEVIDADITLMYFLAQKIENWQPEVKALRLKEVITDYKTTILNELDLKQEAANTMKLRHNFINSDMLYVPFVYESLCHDNILVSERIYATPIAKVNKQNTPEINLKLLAERGVKVFFTQLFRDNFFHADMHPGNIFVDVSNPNNPSFIGIDCAIIGELSDFDRQFLAQNFIAFFNKNYRELAELYVNANWVDKKTNITALEKAIEHVCEPIFNKSLSEISFANVLLNLFTVARQFNMEIQPQLILLEKTLFYVEGLGRQLYPELDLWQTAKPFIENWYKDQLSLKSLYSKTNKLLPKWKNLLLTLPQKVNLYEQEQQHLNKKIDNLGELLKSSNKKQTKLIYLNIFLVFVLMISLLIINY